MRIGQGVVNGPVKREPRRVDGPVAVANDVALHVHFHQVRGRYLAVMQTERVD